MDTDQSAAVRLRLFARYAELVGTGELELAMPLPATVEAVVAHLKAQHAGAALIPDRPLAAVNLRHVASDHLVRAGDELSLLPPVAGG
jgi:molybdopterin converting factor small subunit